MRITILAACLLMIPGGLVFAAPGLAPVPQGEAGGAQLAMANAKPAAAAKSGKKKGKDKEPEAPKAIEPVQLYVVDGCEACAALLNYLNKAGVKLELKKVDRSSCAAYPTVVYSDGAADHGERIYAQKVPLPKSVKVEDARSGS